MDCEKIKLKGKKTADNFITNNFLLCSHVFKTFKFELNIFFFSQGFFKPLQCFACLSTFVADDFAQTLWQKPI